MSRKDEIALVKRLLAELSCRNMPCHMRPLGMPAGQVTNGPCRCVRVIPYEERSKITEALVLYQKLVALLEEQIRYEN